MDGAVCEAKGLSGGGEDGGPRGSGSDCLRHGFPDRASCDNG